MPPRPRSPRPVAPRPPRDVPSQEQLLFPLLDVLVERGGAVTPAEAAHALADRVDLAAEARMRTVPVGGDRAVSHWARHVRFVREKAKALGFVSGPTRNLWAITPAGRDGLRTARPGVVITVFETARGQAIFGQCETAMACLPAGEHALILTSPPYALTTPKEYGNRDTDAHIEWLLSLAARWSDLLTDDGTIILNVGPAWMKGAPTQSVWRQELLVRLVKEVGLHFAQTFYWNNPSKLPTPAEWVTVRRVRVTESVEECYALTKSPTRSRWNNRRVLTPYSDRMTATLARGGDRAQRRPSGHVLVDGAFGRDNGGAIPKNLLQFPNTDSSSPYFQHCRRLGVKPHPARFPNALANFLIRLTTEEGDSVYDPFGGSLTVAEECERLNRRWVTTEQTLNYLAGGGGRLVGAPGFVDHLGLDAMAPAAPMMPAAR